MNRAVWTLFALAAVIAAGVGGYHAGRHGFSVTGLGAFALPTSAAAAGSGPVIYYRDPDGKPFYSEEPRSSEDGRAWIAVRASEEINFDDKPPAGQSDDQGEGGQTDRKIIYYRNPMGLADVSQAPKKDSMGMDYIPVYEDEGSDDATVKVSLGRLQRTGVRSEMIERRVVSVRVRAPGTIQLDERRVAVVSLRSEAFIEKVENVTTGDQVRKGQPLLQFYAPDVAAAAAQYLSALGSPSSGGGAYAMEGARRRLENLAVSADAMAEIARTRKVPLTMTFSAPRDGVLLERTAVEGMRATPGDVLFRLADLSTVWALVDVAEHDLPMIALGQSAIVRLRAYPGAVFSGEIARIHPQINSATRTARLRIELSNPDGLLRQDMYVDAEVATGSGEPVVAAPTSALIDSGARQVVILDKGEGRFEPREVKVGRRDENFIEIREGVAEGDAVVVAANFLIDAESNLKAALRALATPEAQP